MQDRGTGRVYRRSTAARAARSRALASESRFAGVRPPAARSAGPAGRHRRDDRSRPGGPRNPAARKRCGRIDVLGRAVEQHQVRARASTALDVGGNSVADIGHRPGGGGLVAPAGAAHQPIARVDGEEQLGGGGAQRDDPAGRLRRAARCHRRHRRRPGCPPAAPARSAGGEQAARRGKASGFK